MLSYQHGYHAGNFADVVKHLTLTRLLNYMIGKDKPLFYLETHSGRGIYDLKDNKALKTGEASQGIELIFNQKEKLPEVFNLYLKEIAELNHEGKLRYYPGSPSIAISGLRQQDRLFFAELHPQEFLYLNKLRRKSKYTTYSNINGLDLLKSMLPPPERRGLIFIDPSFEIKSEYKELPILIKNAYDRFPTGVYCVWYPIVANNLYLQLRRGLDKIAPSNKLLIEFYLNDPTIKGMTGCGLYIINPPYLVKNEVTLALETLVKIINKSSFLIES